MTHDPDTCMCDACLKVRIKQLVSQRELDEAIREYEARRGGEIGSITLQDALRDREK